MLSLKSKPPGARCRLKSIVGRSVHGVLYNSIYYIGVHGQFRFYPRDGRRLLVVNIALLCALEWTRVRRVRRRLSKHRQLVRHVYVTSVTYSHNMTDDIAQLSLAAAALSARQRV